MKKAFYSFKRNLFGEDILPAEQQASMTLKVRTLVAELETKIGTESYTRDQIKTKFAGRIAQMLEQLNNIIHKLEKDTGKRLVLIVEDLDKFDLQETRSLFLEHARTLTAPQAHVIYSFPVAMRYSNNFPEISKGFDSVYLLPNVTLSHRKGGQNQSGIETLERILLNRVSPQLFTSDALARIIQLSGGHLKSLIQLSQQAVLKAIVANARVVELEQFERSTNLHSRSQSTHDKRYRPATTGAEPVPQHWR